MIGRDETVHDRLGGDELLTSVEVAVMFRVDPRTVVLWAKLGRVATLLHPWRPAPLLA